MAGGFQEGVFQIKAWQSAQHSSCRTGANFYRYLRGKKKQTRTSRKQRSKSVDVGVAFFPLLKNSNGENEVVLAWMWQLGGWKLLEWAREQSTSHRAKDI